MDDEKFRALFARVLATGTMVEVLAFAFLESQPHVVRPAFVATLRNAAKDIGPPGTMSDAAAEIMADVRVQAGDALELMVQRVEAMLAATSWSP